MRQSKFEKLTDDQIARFRKLWTGREPTAEIARQYDIDRATVRAWAVRPQVKKSSPLPQAGMTAISIWRTRMMIEHPLPHGGNGCSTIRSQPSYACISPA